MEERSRRPIRDWPAQFWADLKASTDAGLLSVLRFLGLLYGPIEHDRPIDEAFRAALRRRLPAHVGWGHALGGITYLLFIVLVVTGVLLSFYYRPSSQEAYPSVQYIVSEVTLGWLIRDLHVWSANLIVLALLAHMARVFFAGAYKPPRETSWLVGLLLFLVVLAFGATGYLLPWDQWAYWTVTEALNEFEKVPIVGGVVARLLRGDVFISGATLSRFFAIHVILLPWVAFALLAFHFAMVRKHGVAPPQHGGSAREGVPFYPHHLLRSFIASMLVLGAVFTLALLYPRPVGDRATPFELPSEIVSSWIVVDVTLALIRYAGAWGLVGFTLFALGLAVLPLFDRRPERRLRRRPIAAALGTLFLLAFLAAWLLGREIRSVPPPAGLEPRGLDGRVGPGLPGQPLPGLGREPIRPPPAPGASRQGAERR